jgi:acetylornithine deacetylase/succinyl-diaminopimelate desuccinylase-like protein
MRLSALLACAALGAIALRAAAQDAPTTPGGREAMAILKEAVAIPTVEGRGQVPVLADKIRTRLIAAGFAPADVTFTPLGETGYLTARLPGRDRKAKPLLVIGHLDVVEAKAADWARDPFAPVVENGFVYGRGVYDNKAGVAITLAAVLTLHREGWRPARDIVLAFSGDEETQMQTTRAMAEAFKDAELALNVDAGEGELAPDGRPRVYTMQAGEKTYADYAITVSDPGGHSSRPGPTNAIATMGAALGRIAAHRFAPQVSPLTKAYWLASAREAPADLAAAMRAFAANPADAQAADLLSAKPEYVGQVRTTCVPTTIAGGHAPNALPQSVTANVNCRIFPGTPRTAIKATLESLIGDRAVTVTQLEAGSLEAPESPLRSDVVAAVERAVHERVPGLTIVPGMSAGASDSMYFRARGIPAFGIAPVFIRPEDDFSHGLNERLPVATLDPGVRQMETLLRTIAR